MNSRNRFCEPLPAAVLWGMEFIDPKLQAYLTEHAEPEPELLQKLHRETHFKVMQPRMLSGHLQGRFLSLISKMLRPSYILEIGTYTGYSALCLAEGLRDGGKLITIDNNPEREALVNRYIQEAGMQDKVQHRVGQAVDLIARLEPGFDLVFIDADKSNYSLYYDLLVDRIPSGGVILADNVLWSGKVIQPVKSNDGDTIALLEFNRKVQRDPRVEVVILPLRDGISLIRKR